MILFPLIEGNQCFTGVLSGLAQRYFYDLLTLK